MGFTSANMQFSDSYWLTFAYSFPIRRGACCQARPACAGRPFPRPLRGLLVGSEHSLRTALEVTSYYKTVDQIQRTVMIASLDSQIFLFQTNPPPFWGVPLQVWAFKLTVFRFEGGTAYKNPPHNPYEFHKAYASRPWAHQSCTGKYQIFKIGLCVLLPDRNLIQIYASLEFTNKNVAPMKCSFLTVTLRAIR